MARITIANVSEYLSAKFLLVLTPFQMWMIKKFQGGSEFTLKCRVNLSQALKQDSNIKSQFGPISVNFEIPMYNVSKIQVRYLRISTGNAAYNPYRWVRYVTQSNSYVCRLS